MNKRLFLEIAKSVATGEGARLGRPQACPSCGRHLEGVRDMHGGGTEPSPGDVSICFHCREPMIFQDDMSVRLLSAEEVADLCVRDAEFFEAYLFSRPQARLEPTRAWCDIATGYHCLLSQNRVGILLGYVMVPQGHPAHGKHYDDDLVANIDVHGGLTFADDVDEDLWAFGFDCGHAGDFMPFAPDLGGQVRNADFVHRECERLAAQLKAMERG